MMLGKLKVLSIWDLIAVGLLLGSFVTLALGGEAANAEDKLVLAARSRVETSQGSGKFIVVYKQLQWEPTQTAIIVCDMWDQHWCKGASSRVADLAPRMNDVISKAYEKGVFIIHSPSETMEYYKNHPARKKAVEAPQAANLPPDIDKWCNWINDKEQLAGYPIDHSDGGCDCEPKCKQGNPWRKQIETINIRDEDAITDSGAEAWNLLEQRDIKNVIIMGVHTNMCVLGRPFGLRNIARFGKNVVLMRDMTDTMYNSKMRPFVNHFTGTDFVVEHIERFVCPTITSTVFTGKSAFSFKDDKRPRVVFISGEDEYKAAETLPEFMHELQLKYGLYCNILQSSTDKNSKESNFIYGMEELTSANLAVLYVRRRAFQTEQMKYFRDYLENGKPLVAFRTASHAFDTRGKCPHGHIEWVKFDPEVLGGNYNGHYGSGPITTVTIAAGIQDHPILAGIELPFISNGSLYKASPLSKTTEALLMGAIPNQSPEPVAWTNVNKNGRVFYTSLGHPDDFANPQFHKLLINAVFWAMNKPLPKEKTASNTGL
jgi:type 1 glutamine amidotransferase/nicotinamidase-related amidase